MRQLHAVVSILARPEGRALRLPSMSSDALISSFQSSPGPKAGRSARRGQHYGRSGDVSILARPEGRALLPGLH